MRPVRFLYLCILVCVLSTHTVLHFFLLPKVPFKEIGALKKILKSQICIFTVRPVRFIYLYFKVYA